MKALRFVVGLPILVPLFILATVFTFIGWFLPQGKSHPSDFNLDSVAWGALPLTASLAAYLFVGWVASIFLLVRYVSVDEGWTTARSLAFAYLAVTFILGYLGTQVGANWDEVKERAAGLVAAVRGESDD